MILDDTKVTLNALLVTSGSGIMGLSHLGWKQTTLGSFVNSKLPELTEESFMSKKTSTSSVNGHLTGKTVTERSGSYTRSTNYKNTGSSTWGPNWKATSTTVTDGSGNSRTKKY